MIPTTRDLMRDAEPLAHVLTAGPQAWAAGKAANSIPTATDTREDVRAAWRASQGLAAPSTNDVIQDRASAEGFRFTVVRCPCGEVVLEAHFRGAVRVKCAARNGCKQRLLVVSDGRRVRITLTDTPNARVN